MAARAGIARRKVRLHLDADDLAHANRLFSIGFRRQHVRMQVYGHELESAASVVEWVKGTLLTDYERRIGNRYQEFLAEYTKRLLERLDATAAVFLHVQADSDVGSF